MGVGHHPLIGSGNLQAGTASKQAGLGAQVGLGDGVGVGIGVDVALHTPFEHIPVANLQAIKGHLWPGAQVGQIPIVQETPFRTPVQLETGLGWQIPDASGVGALFVPSE